MLVRDPSKRPTLESILADPWLCKPLPNDPGQSSQNSNNNATDFASLLETSPLISHEQLSKEEREYILNSMVEGGLAQNLEEILNSMKSDS